MSPNDNAPSKDSWQPLGPIVSGGTVYAVAVSPLDDAPAYWAATGSGVFVSQDGGKSWQQRLSGLTSPLISGLAVAPSGALFAGSLDAGLFVSLDLGQTWSKGKPSYDLKGAVTVMATSPNFRTDSTAFAALDGGAVMVTRNNGTTWEDASFGLSSTTAFALAVSPDWSRYETMWASTEAGVYISRNGGRAWRATSLVQPDIVDALAASPAFAVDQTVYAGTESGALHMSTDGGRNWTLLHTQIGEGPLSSLWLAPDFCDSGTMVAGVGNGVYLSTDRGATWEKTTDLPGSVMSLAGDGRVLLAGLHEQGVHVSMDGGRTWAPAPGEFVARGFTRLVAAGKALYTMGPQDGIYVSRDAGSSWEALDGLDEHMPLTALAVTPDEAVFTAGHDSGLLQLASSRRSWRVRSEEKGVSAVALATGENLGWAGTGEGKLLITRDGGSNWAVTEEAPARTQPVVAIAVSPTFADDHTLYVGTSIPPRRKARGKVVLWRSRNSGKTWHQVTTQETDSLWMDITMPVDVDDRASDQAVLATGPYCLRPLRKAKDVWISTQVDPSGASVLSVVAVGDVEDGGVLYAATGNGVFRSTDSGRTWADFSEGIEGKSLVALALLGQGEHKTLLALSLGGLVFRRAIA